MTCTISGYGKVKMSEDLAKPRGGRRHSMQISSLSKDMEKLNISERKEEVKKEGVKCSNSSTAGESEDNIKHLRKMSTKRRTNRQGNPHPPHQRKLKNITKFTSGFFHFLDLAVAK